MTPDPWFAFAVGSIVTGTSILAFLYTLRLGLHRSLWWPLGIVVSAWLIAMAAYSMWDSRAQGHGGRQRIVDAPMLP